jgi:hypothetical protein
MKQYLGNATQVTTHIEEVISLSLNLLLRRSDVIIIFECPEFVVILDVLVLDEFCEMEELINCLLAEEKQRDLVGHCLFLE